MLKFLGDANRLAAEVKGGIARAGGAEIAADGVPMDRPRSMPARVISIGRQQGPPFSATVSRVLDRPASAASWRPP